MKFEYIPSDFICSTRYEFEIDEKNSVILSLTVTGTCHGNLQGISCLLSGMTVQEAISRLEGICCVNKPTSCPDQIARALKEFAAGKR